MLTYLLTYSIHHTMIIIIKYKRPLKKRVIELKYYWGCNTVHNDTPIPLRHCFHGLDDHIYKQGAMKSNQLPQLLAWKDTYYNGFFELSP